MAGKSRWQRGRWWGAGAALILAILAGSARAAAWSPATPALEGISVTADGAHASYLFDAPRVTTAADGLVDVALHGAFLVRQTGAPMLPESVAAIQLPTDAQVTDCRVVASNTVPVDLNGLVRYGPSPAPYSAGPGLPATPDPVIYALATPVPELAPAVWNMERRDGGAVLNVRLNPVQYVPRENRLLTHRRLDVFVSWTRAAAAPAAAIAPMAKSLAVPFGVAAPLLTTGRVDYVVITSSNLLATPPPNNFQGLCAVRSRDGFAATNVTVEWICANYNGTRPDGGTDDATRIRNFILDAHSNWGTRYVLLGGTACSPVIVPARALTGCVVMASGPYADSIGSDLYYACLDGTFDGNRNGIYGEASDGVAGRDVDLLAEVYVGRFPVATTNEVANMVRKTLAYENATPDQLRRVCHVGEWLGFGGVADYATADMEQLRLGGTYDDYTTIGFSNSVYAGVYDISDCLYDSPTYAWPNTELLNRFDAGYHVFNHFGHGNYTYGLKLCNQNPADLAAMIALTNTTYFFIYSQACECGRFDDVAECLAETLVRATNGPVAVIMNSREGWGAGNSTDGASQRYHRQFWDLLLGGGAHTFGEANQKSKEALRYEIYDYSGAMRWTYYELTLFGDPALPFGARVSRLPPQIAHTPLVNQATSAAPFRVDCQLGPTGLYDPDSAQLVWRSSLAPDQVQTVALTQVVGPEYMASIPEQPEGTAVSYKLLLTTRAGLAGAFPTDATSEVRFYVAPRCTLDVAGDPVSAGVVAPPYGANVVVSGNVVQASATLRDVSVDGRTAWRCIGWLGDGSVPPAGSATQTTFIVDQTSHLTWLWTNEVVLTQQSSPAGVLPPASTWCTAGTTAATATAAARVAWGGTNYVFAGWYVDGVRQPAAGRAANPATGLAMDAPRDACALYLPVTQDSDGDLLPDWWEMYWFGTLAFDAASDADGDGFGLLDEYRDQTDPTDPSSYPAPPQISFVPLPAILNQPPPYAVAATFSDTSPLVCTQLVWRRNGGTWQTNAFTVAAGAASNTCQAVMAGAGVPGDCFEYRIEAVDSDFLLARSATCTSRVQYAVIALLPPLSYAWTTAPPAIVGGFLSFSNAGNADLVWQAYAGFGEYADAPPPDWNLAAGGGFNWTWTTNRCASAPGSLHAVITSPPKNTFVSQHARLDAPPLRLGPHAVLAFNHWIASELDTALAGHCFDGGVVEISTNGGLSFAILPGPYTHVITGWTASPWPGGTACFAGAGAGWTNVAFDLSAYTNVEVRLRFHYGADDNTDREGWYIDNIRVAPLDPACVPGTALAPASATLAPQATASLVAAVDSSAFLRRWLRVPVLIRSNDPTATNVWFDLACESQRPPVLTLAAAQSTNGDGLVAVNGTFIDPDGESRTLAFAYSCDDGATWLAPQFTTQSFVHGTATLHAAMATIDHAPAAGEAAFATNAFTLQWNTRHPSNAVSLAMQTLLRATVTDPLFDSVSTLAPTFVVDNQPPATPVIQVFTHRPGVWSSSRQLVFAWSTSDGAGSGLQWHQVALAHPGAGPGGTNVTVQTAPPLLALDTGADSSNWWLTVVACDRMGNTATNRAGPFWIDATPPDVSTACMATVWGFCGRYVVGTPLPLLASNITDALSGVAGYTFSNDSRPDAPAAFATTNAVSWTAVVWNATNTFRVVAVDAAGNRSAAVTVSLLVLDPLSDTDGDGITAADEETMGTSPLVPSSRFALTSAVPVPGGGLALGWRSVAGRFYTVENTTVLSGAGGWLALPGFAAMPGSNGVMSVVVPLGSSPKFYRVRVSR